MSDNTLQINNINFHKIEDNTNNLMETNNTIEELESNDHSQESNINLGHSKVTEAQWKKMEEDVNLHTKRVLDAMRNNETDLYDTKLRSCGKELYDTIIRPKLLELGLINNKKNELINQEMDEKKEKKKPQKKADIIKTENSLKSIKKDLDDLLNLLKTYDIDRMDEHGFKKNLIELRCCTLLYMSYYILNKNKNNLNKTEKGLREKGYKLILTLRSVKEQIANRKFINMSNSDQSNNVSDKLLSDLQNADDDVNSLVKYSEKIMFKKYPHLVDKSHFYNVLPIFSIKLRPMQREFMETATNNEEYLIINDANLSQGKTTSVIAIVNRIMAMKKNTEVIYLCPSETTRYGLCNMLYNSSIPFGIATSDKERVTNSHFVRHLARSSKDKKNIDRISCNNSM